MNLIDLIFPKKCVNCSKSGDYVCANCLPFISFDVKNLCLVCDKPTYNSLTHPKCKSRYSIDGCFSAISYNKIARKLIFNFKYKPYLSDLKTFLSELFVESIIQNEQFMKLIANGEWLMAPVPLYGSKLRKRGYNQAEILSIALSKKLNIPVQNLLVRLKDTKSQFKLTKEERKENIKEAFELDDRSLKLEARNIFLVDDVVTTGSTLKEAANVLKRAGAKVVFGLTLARD